MSRCLFGIHLYPEHPYSLWNVELGLRITGDISKQLTLSNAASLPSRYHYGLGVNKNTLVLPTSPYDRGARCVLFNGNNNKVEMSNTELIQNAGHCTGKHDAQIQFLPGMIQIQLTFYYGKSSRSVCLRYYWC